jgi:hypothetical protein
MEKRENEKVEVSCKVSNAKPAAEVAWFRNNVPFNPGKGILQTDKKKIKFSSYIRKFRVEQLQSHI